MGIDMNWAFLIQIGIVVILFMIYLSTRSIVDVLNHWGSQIDNNQDKIIKELEQNR